MKIIIRLILGFVAVAIIIAILPLNAFRMAMSNPLILDYYSFY